MNDILQRICAAKRPEVAAAKRDVPLSVLERRIAALPEPPDFRAALCRKPGQGRRIIAELKKASPSKGMIRENFTPAELARELERSGAAALSVLTERNFFLGSETVLEEAAKTVRLPLLRKDFIFDPYQIAEARALGAAAVLLIAAMLSDVELNTLAAAAGNYGLSVLFEAHDEREIDRVMAAGAGIVGVNARNLVDFSTDAECAAELISGLPDRVVKVAESAIRNRAALTMLEAAGANAFLIGETLMRAEHPGDRLRELL